MLACLVMLVVGPPEALEASRSPSRGGAAASIESVESDFGGHDRLDPWESQPERWRDWLIPSMRETTRLANHLDGDFDEETDPLKPSDGLLYSFDFPVFVINLPSRPDRRAHTEELLASLGFSNVIFPPVRTAESLDIEEEVSYLLQSLLQSLHLVKESSDLVNVSATTENSRFTAPQLVSPVRKPFSSSAP